MTRSQPRYSKGDFIDNRYKVHDVKMGGMGEVYLCLDLETDSPFALKTFQQRFLTNYRLRKTFDQEVNIWINLDIHPNIVPCFWMRRLDDQPFMCLEWVTSTFGRGTDLRSWLQFGAIDLRQALEVTIDICRGLDYARTKVPGLVHRDLKPENILLSQGILAKITDFGLAKAIERSELNLSSDNPNNQMVNLIEFNGVVGTPAYMAPEQWEGEEVDVRTDIYAIGCILYEMLVGHPLFQAKSPSELRRLHLEIEPQNLFLRNDLSSALESILVRCMAKQQKDRFQEIDDLFEAITFVFGELFGEMPSLSIDNDYLLGIDHNSRAVTYSELGRITDALAHYDLAIKQGFDDSLVYANRAATFNSVGRHLEAIEDANRAIILNPTNYIAYHARAAAYGYLGKFEAALSDHNQCIGANPFDVQGYINRGVTYSLLKEYDAAISDFTKAIELKPDLARSYISRARVYGQMNKLSLAITDLSQAIQLNPGSVEVLIELGNILEELGEDEEVVAVLSRAIEVDPQIEVAYTNRGIVYKRMGNYEAAKADWKKAISVAPDSVSAHFNYANLLVELGSLEQAVAHYTEAIKYGSQMGAKNQHFQFSISNFYMDGVLNSTSLDDRKRIDSQIYAARAAAYTMLGQNQAALGDLDEAINLDFKSADLYFQRGNRYLEIRAYVPAIRDFTRSIELNSNFSEAYLNRGITYGKLKEYDNAEIDLKRALELKPNDAQTFLNRGGIYIEQKQWKLALADLNRAAEIDPQYFQVYLNRGTVHLILGNKEWASKDFLEAIKVRPDAPEGYLKLGDLLAEDGKYNKALNKYNNAIAVDPQDPESFVRAGHFLMIIGRLKQAALYLECAAELGSGKAQILLSDMKPILLLSIAIKTTNIDDFREEVHQLPIRIDKDLLDIFEKDLQDMRTYDPSFDQAYLGVLQDLFESQQNQGYLVYKDFKPVNEVGEQDVDLPHNDSNEQSASASETKAQMVKDFVKNGFYYLNEKNYEKAIRFFDAALELDPGNSTLYGSRAIVYTELERFEEAAKNIEQAIRTGDDNAMYYAAYGSLLIKMERYSESEDSYKKALKFAPDDALECEQVAGYLIENDQYQYALAFYERAALLGSEQSREYSSRLLNQLSFEAWMHSNTIEVMRGAVEMFPHIASILYIQNQEQQVVDRFPEIKQGLLSRLNLLRDVREEQGQDGILIFFMIAQAIGSAITYDQLKEVVNKYYQIRNPGYILFTSQLLLGKAPHDVKEVILERVLTLWDIVHREY